LNIELDGIALIWTDQDSAGGITEVRNVSNITTNDKRSMVEHEVPGMEGNTFQDQGRSPVKISFAGSLQGKTAKSMIEVIRSKFKLGAPLPFNSDITGSTDVTKVLIEELNVEDIAGGANRYRYSIVLREYKEPPPEPVTPPTQDKEATESINCLTGKVLDSDGNPRAGIGVIASSDDGEFKGETDEEGVYRLEDLPSGRYRVTVDSEEYEGIEEIVFIGSEEETPAEQESEETPAEQQESEETPAEQESEETPAEQESEETPAEQQESEETPAGQESEETPAEQESEETPASQESEETPASQESEETPAEQSVEESPTGEEAQPEENSDQPQEGAEAVSEEPVQGEDT
jgi:flagellar biosynthesis GTPase FlhF